jgi:signal peptidase complex subunit 2
VVLNVVLLILSYTKEKDAILFTHPPAVCLYLDLLLLNSDFPSVHVNVQSILLSS